MRALAFLASAAWLAGCASVRPLAYEDRLLAAVMPFTYSAKSAEHASALEGLTDSLAGALTRTGRLRLVERHRVDSVLKEARLGLTGAVDPATAAKIGRQLGAEAVILGAVVSAGVFEETASVGIATKTDRWAEVAAEARLVTVETGELLAAARASGKAKSKDRRAFGAKAGSLADPAVLVQKASQGLIEELAKELARSVPSRSALKR